MENKFTIVIPTKNRLDELIITLGKLKFLLDRVDVHFLICDDGSTDGTFDYITKFFPKIEIFSNKISKGIHYTRNRLMEKVKTPYAINIDDDIHFITTNPIEIIEPFFDLYQECAIIAFRIFWSELPPDSIETNSKAQRVQSFGAGASVWRMSAWNAIPNYPEWFFFYGEEDFASHHLFKNNWQIHYVPEVLVNHRVDLKARKKNQDYSLRLRRSLRAGWYLYFLFYPWKIIPRKLMYSLWIQIKTKVVKGDLKAAKAIFQAVGDLVINFPKILKQNNRFTLDEYQAYQKLSKSKLYWNPKDEK